MISPIRTAEPLAQLPGDENRYELVAGVLRMTSPTGGRHGRIAGRIFRSLANHVRQHALGETLAAETHIGVLHSTELLDASDAVEGWKVDITEFFS